MYVIYEVKYRYTYIFLVHNVHDLLISLYIILYYLTSGVGEGVFDVAGGGSSFPPREWVDDSNNYYYTNRTDAGIQMITRVQRPETHTRPDLVSTPLRPSPYFNIFEKNKNKYLKKSS